MRNLLLITTILTVVTSSAYAAPVYTQGNPNSGLYIDQVQNGLGNSIVQNVASGNNVALYQVGDGSALNTETVTVTGQKNASNVSQVGLLNRATLSDNAYNSDAGIAQVNNSYHNVASIQQGEHDLGGNSGFGDNGVGSTNTADHNNHASIYQGSSGNNASITQEGSYRNYNTANSSATINQTGGNSNIASISQTGVGSKTAIVNQYSSGEYAQVIDDSNSNGSYVQVVQNNANSQAVIRNHGANNQVFTTQDPSSDPSYGTGGNHLGVLVSGSNNQSAVLQRGSNNEAAIAQGVNLNGSTSLAAISSLANAASSYYAPVTNDTAAIDQEGSGNHAGISQTGSFQNAGDITKVGHVYSNNGIIQYGDNNYAYISQSGYGNTASITQGTSYQPSYGAQASLNQTGTFDKDSIVETVYGYTSAGAPSVALNDQGSRNTIAVTEDAAFLKPFTYTTNVVGKTINIHNNVGG